MRSRQLTLAGTALAALVLSACGNGDGDSAEADLPDDLEGELTFVCSPNEELCAAWADAFESETGVCGSWTRTSCSTPAPVPPRPRWLAAARSPAP